MRDTKQVRGKVAQRVGLTPGVGSAGEDECIDDPLDGVDGADTCTGENGEVELGVVHDQLPCGLDDRADDRDLRGVAGVGDQSGRAVRERDALALPAKSALHPTGLGVEAASTRVSRLAAPSARRDPA